MSITYDYSYSDVYFSEASGLAGGLLVFLIISIVFSLAISVFILISYFKLFKKNGKPGWYAFIPVFNIWTLLELVGIKGWWCLVPFANFVFMLIGLYKLAIKMGKSKGMAIFIVIVPMIGIPILAFSKTTNASVESVSASSDMQINEAVSTPVAASLDIPSNNSNLSYGAIDNQSNSLEINQNVSLSAANVVSSIDSSSVASLDSSTVIKNTAVSSEIGTINNPSNNLGVDNSVGADNTAIDNNLTNSSDMSVSPVSEVMSVPAQVTSNPSSILDVENSSMIAPDSNLNNQVMQADNFNAPPIAAPTISPIDDDGHII